MGDEIIDKEQLLEAFNNLGVSNVDELVNNWLFNSFDLSFDLKFLSRIYEKLTGLEFVTTQNLLEIIESIQRNSEGKSWRNEECSANVDSQMSMSSATLIHKNLNIFSSFPTS